MAEEIAKLVRKENQQILSGAIVQLVTGTIYCSLSFGFVFLLLLIPSSAVAELLDFGTIPINVFVTLIVVLVCFVSAWRKVNPWEHLDPLTIQQQAMANVASATGLGYFNPRHATAGVAMLLLAGPETLLAGLAAWRRRLSSGGELFHLSAALLQQSKDGLPAQDADPPEAFVLLMRLSLIKLAPGHGGTTVVLTQKGRDTSRCFPLSTQSQ